MATSRIPSARAALLTMLAARENLDGVQVVGEMPASIGRELIMLGAADATQEYRTIGGPTGAAKHETFELDVLVTVLREGRGGTEADSRAFELFAEVESAIRTDPTLSGSVDVAQIITYRHEPRVSDTAREAVLNITVRCETRI